MSLFEWNLKNEINLPNSSWKRALLLTGLCLDTLYFLPIFLFSHSEVHTVALLPKNLVFGTLALQMSPGAISICSWRFYVNYGTYLQSGKEEGRGKRWSFFFFFYKKGWPSLTLRSFFNGRRSLNKNCPIFQIN